jgi:hypothetical protein
MAEAPQVTSNNKTTNVVDSIGATGRGLGIEENSTSTTLAMQSSVQAIPVSMTKRRISGKVITFAHLSSVLSHRL